MAEARMAKQLAPDQLTFTSLNTSAPTTILLIHGVGATDTDWDLVIAQLPSETYHILAPSLFTEESRAAARTIRATTNNKRWNDSYADLLARLVRSHAKNGQAHIVGLSLGACFAINLVAVHPDTALSVFVSGLPAYRSKPPAFIQSSATTMFWGVQRLTEALGPKVVGKLLEGKVDLGPGSWFGNGNRSSREMCEVCIDTIASGRELSAWKIARSKGEEEQSASMAGFRLRIVAATRTSALILIGDPVDWATVVAKQVSGTLPEGQEASTPKSQHSYPAIDARVYQAKNMFHPWYRQDPELFAKCIIATIEGIDSAFETEELTETWCSPV